MVETEPVFSTPDPAEAERVRAFLAAQGLRPALERGPDPVTGVGGAVFGGAGAGIYNVSVPRSLADRACELLSDAAPPAGDVAPEEEEAPRRADHPPTTRLRRYAPQIVTLFFFLNWMAYMLRPGGSGLTLARWIAGVLALLAAGVTVARMRAGAPDPPSR